MMFSKPYEPYSRSRRSRGRSICFLLLHADHEQNCSPPPCGWSPPAAQLFASVAAGVCALWGPLHGGANMAVVEMLKASTTRGTTARFIEPQAENKAATG